MPLHERPPARGRALAVSAGSVRTPNALLLSEFFVGCPRRRMAAMAIPLGLMESRIARALFS